MSQRISWQAPQRSVWVKGSFSATASPRRFCSTHHFGNRLQMEILLQTPFFQPFPNGVPSLYILFEAVFKSRWPIQILSSDFLLHQVAFGDLISQFNFAVKQPS